MGWMASNHKFSDFKSVNEVLIVGWIKMNKLGIFQLKHEKELSIYYFR